MSVRLSVCADGKWCVIWLCVAPVSAFCLGLYICTYILAVVSEVKRAYQCRTPPGKIHENLALFGCAEVAHSHTIVTLRVVWGSECRQYVSAVPCP